MGINMTGIAETIFWACAAILIYVYLGYPLLLALIAAFARRPEPEPDYLPTLSVLLSAYNEEAHIGQKIERTLKLDYPADKLEVVVVSDGSVDRTDSIVRSFHDSRVRLLRIPSRRGKTNAQNEGVRICRGEIVVFSDATTLYHSQALRHLASNYQDPRVGAVSGRYQYFDPAGQSPTGLGSIAFWNYENLIKTFQSKIKTITGCCGCIYSIRRRLYTPLPDDIISDLVQPLKVILKGYRVIFERRALAYEETTQSAQQEFSMRVRVVTRGMRGLLSVPDLLKPWKWPWESFQLLSHKVLRWLVPFFLIGLFVTSAILWSQPIFKLFFLAQALFYLTAIFSLFVPAHRRWKPFAMPLYFCTLNAAALVSLLEVCRGKRYVVWETVRQ
jgi:cellulose synthase/poly-beta-1,6-N-acetylglucosamine synthase-like glycosyltransferase